MGRALVEARLRRGDEVVAIGSSAEKGRDLPAGAHFLRADLSSVAETGRVIAEIGARWPVVDALGLFANRQATRRVVTADGLEQTFALYYLSRYLLSHGLRPHLERAAAPVIVNVAGVGVTKGEIHWDDLQLARRYGMVAAQLQAGRAIDLLGVDFAARSGSRVRYVLYHPGFTRSGDLSPLPPPVRAGIQLLARFLARPVADSVRPVLEWIDQPPAAALTAMDRGEPVDLGGREAAARRLAAATEEVLGRLPPT
jgi:NAD(P)-dependent dehydrogenase (short-subunit alcohol dehydrogenase family)